MIYIFCFWLQKSKKKALVDDKSLEPPVAPIVTPVVEPDNSYQIPPPEEVKLVEVEDEQTKHAYSVAVAAAAAAQAAAAAAQAAAESVRLAELTRYSGKSKEEVAAIRIQTTFRGYLVSQYQFQFLIKFKSGVWIPWLLHIEASRNIF